MITALLLSCTATGPDPAGETGIGGEDSAAPLEETGPERLAPEAVTAQLDAFFSVGIPTASPILSAWYAALEHGDADCPGEGDQILTVPEGCTTDDGYWFSGLGSYQASPGKDGVEGWSFTGEFEVIDDAGLVFGAGGAVGTARSTKDDGGFIATTVNGTWSLDGGEPFLDAGFSGQSTISASKQKDGMIVTLDGMISYGNEIVVGFTDIRNTPDCPEFITGLAQTRDEHGRWYQFDLAGCSPCGIVSLDGEELGEACLTAEDIPASILTALKEEL